MCYECLRAVLFRVTILAEWLSHFNDLAVGETAAPACFSRENAEGAGMPPLLSLRNDQTRNIRVNGRAQPVNTNICVYKENAPNPETDGDC
jgi:hypothetical protein